MTMGSNSKSDIRELVKKLWSSSDAERELAKMQLSESGAEAIPPLLNLLLDLANNRHPRFLTGKEKEGEAVVKNYCDILRQEGYLSSKLLALSKKIDELAINYRLAMDTIFLLGKLKAEAAVPFLIKIMESFSTNGNAYAYTEEKIALQAIGSSAIPSLLKTLKEAASRVRSSSIEDIHFHYWISWESHDKRPKDSIDCSVSKLNFVFEEGELSERDIQIAKYFIQFSALIVLRKMKAHQAIPDLKKIIKETEDEQLKSLIMEAITQIRSPYPEGTIGEKKG